VKIISVILEKVYAEGNVVWMGEGKSFTTFMGIIFPVSGSNLHTPNAEITENFELDRINRINRISNGPDVIYTLLSCFPPFVPSW
jgi:hypothetical protein